MVTHEYADHHAVERLAGVKQTACSSAGTIDTQLGCLVGVASEHDAAAGTQKGANVIYVFEMGGMRVCRIGE